MNGHVVNFLLWHMVYIYIHLRLRLVSLPRALHRKHIWGGKLVMNGHVVVDILLQHT
jgi:hypothetical protein